jgi:hypothetical protein
MELRWNLLPPFLSNEPGTGQKGCLFGAERFAVFLLGVENNE